MVGFDRRVDDFDVQDEVALIGQDKIENAVTRGTCVDVDKLREAVSAAKRIEDEFLRIQLAGSNVGLPINAGEV